jgi:hypothetical protein
LFTACLAAFLLAAYGQATATTPLGDWQTGRSTFYDGIDGGNCGFETIPSSGFPYRNVAGTLTRECCTTCSQVVADL